MPSEELLEELSKLEHEQWEHWSKTLSEELDKIQALINRGKNNLASNNIKNRLFRWRTNWKPYSNLKEAVKEHDRGWARKVMKIIEKYKD